MNVRILVMFSLKEMYTNELNSLFIKVDDRRRVSMMQQQYF